MLDGGVPAAKPDVEAAGLPLKANECIMAVQHLGRPARLFDEFWVEGELALLFGPPGTGKSVLATEIADAIARGRRVDGFEMSAKRQKVLYFDMKLSERQFQSRCLEYGENGEALPGYKFSENLHMFRERPASVDAVVKLLREQIEELGIRAVVIDDLSAVRTNCDGTREMFKLMRELVGLKREFGLSILVLLGSREPGRGREVSEADLLRSRVLCDLADSVFSLGRQVHDPGDLFLMQTRSRSGPLRWTTRTAPACRVERFESGLLGFRFDDRFTPKIDRKTRAEICFVRVRRDAKMSYRQIAELAGYSKSKAFCLDKMWTPEIAEEERRHCGENGEIYGGFLEGEAAAAAVATGSDTQAGPADETDEEAIASILAQFPRENEEFGEFETADPMAEPEAATIGAALDAPLDPMAHLKYSFDKNGREIYVERENERGEYIVWYMRKSDGKFTRWERAKGGGNIGDTVDGPVCWFTSGYGSLDRKDGTERTGIYASIE